MEPELPDLPTDADGNNLGWHALNYRTAHTVHAQALFVELERYVRSYGLQCYRMGVEAERERAAALVADLATIMEWGAGAPEPGGRLRQAERNIRDPEKQPMGVGKFAIRGTDTE